MRMLFLTVMPAPYQRELFAALNAQPGIEVDVRYFTAMSSDRDWRDPGLASYEAVMPGRTLRTLGPSAHWNGSVLAEIKASRSDLVIVSDYSAPSAQVAMRYLAAAGRPFMFWGEVPGFSRRGLIGSWLRGRLQDPLHAAAGIAAIGAIAAEAYRSLFPDTPIFNIPYFCDLEPFRAARAALPSKDADSVDILFSGQLIDRKGVDVLIAAFCAAARTEPRLRLTLLGSGPERERYQGMVPVELADRITFLGHREPKDLPEVFAQADMFCLPSRHDGWGVVVNEALGAGLPILVSDAVGAGRDLVMDGQNGFVVPAGDVGALAQGMRCMASDDALRSAMSAQSRNLARNWGLEEGVRRWMEAARAVLEQARAA